MNLPSLPKNILQHSIALLIGVPAFLMAGGITEGLVAYYPFTKGSLSNQASESVVANVENKGATFGPDRFGNENSAAVFSGDNSYMEIPDHDAFSINTTGALTISVWICPNVLTFSNAEAGGYVHWMGKGEPQQHEWVFRMYNKELESSQENRPNRMSAYAFNLKGGLGSGSYVQEELTAGQWIHFVARYDIKSNTITLFKNGIQKDQDPLYDETYGVQVENGTAPVRLGTRSLWSFFEGSIDDLRFYNRALSDDEILELYNETDPSAVTPNAPPDSTAASDSSKTEAPESIASHRDLTNRRTTPWGYIRRDNSSAHNPYQVQFMIGNKNVDAAGRIAR